MACPRSQLMHSALLLTTIFATSPALAQTSNCEPTKASIAARIRANGVTHFELQVLDRNASTPHKIVGSCEGGSKKIAYVRGGAPAAATTDAKPAGAAPAARADAPAKASGPASASQAPAPTAPAQATAPDPAPQPTAPSRSASAPAAATPAPTVPPATTAPAAPATATPAPATPVAGAKSPAATTPAPSIAAAPAARPAPPTIVKGAVEEAPKSPTPPATGSSAPDTAAAAASLWAQGEQRQCHQVRPTGWSIDRAQVGSSSKPVAPGTPIRQYEADILPPSGHPLAQQGLVLSFRIRPYYVHELRPAMMATYPSADAFNAMVKKPLASLSEGERDFRTTLDGADPADANEWQRTRAVAAEPGVIDGVGVVRLQLIQSGNWTPNDNFTFRSRETMGKDKIAVASHQIPRWSDGVTQRAQVVLDPRHSQGITAGPLANRIVYEFGCWASNQMPAQQFASVCSAFIERSTLAEQFPNGNCVASGDGIDFGR